MYGAAGWAMVRPTTGGDAVNHLLDHITTDSL
jgi:hypothetical protein